MPVEFRKKTCDENNERNMFHETERGRRFFEGVGGNQSGNGARMGRPSFGLINSGQQRPSGTGVLEQATQSASLMWWAGIVRSTCVAPWRFLHSLHVPVHRANQRRGCASSIQHPNRWWPWRPFMAAAYPMRAWWCWRCRGE
jgi:hypothetical protein